MKYGRINKDLLDDISTAMKNFLLMAKSNDATGLLVAPYLESARALKGIRGELRKLGCIKPSMIHFRLFTSKSATPSFYVALSL